MKYCQQCGTQVYDRANYCPQCGSDRLVMIDPTGKGPLNDQRHYGMILLWTAITGGIYGVITMARIGRDVNTIASERDGFIAISFYWVAFLLSWLTFGVYPLIWMHRLSDRIGTELELRNIDYDFSAKTFWTWNVLGAFILVGPFIYHYRLITAMNLVAADYNREHFSA